MFETKNIYPSLHDHTNKSRIFSVDNGSNQRMFSMNNGVVLMRENGDIYSTGLTMRTLKIISNMEAL